MFKFAHQNFSAIQETEFTANYDYDELQKLFSYNFFMAHSRRPEEDVRPPATAPSKNLPENLLHKGCVTDTSRPHIISSYQLVRGV